MNYLVGHIIHCLLLNLTRMDRRNRQNNEDQKDCLHLDSTKLNCDVSIGGLLQLKTHVSRTVINHPLKNFNLYNVVISHRICQFPN